MDQTLGIQCPSENDNGTWILRRWLNIPAIIWEKIGFLLLMEEILHHLEWLKPYKKWDNHHPWLGGAGFCPSTVGKYKKGCNNRTTKQHPLAVGRFCFQRRSKLSGMGTGWANGFLRGKFWFSYPTHTHPGGGFLNVLIIFTPIGGRWPIWLAHIFSDGLV